MRDKNSMQRITISITDEQAARLKGEQLRSGAPVSLQIRRALDLNLPPDEETRARWRGKSNEAQAIIEATGGPAALPHWTEVSKA
jgi:hypothetical protein